MDYVTLAELKGSLKIADTQDDVLLALNIAAASQAIDLWCHRSFGKDSVASARVYWPSGSYVFTDDFVSLTTVHTDPEEDDTFTQLVGATAYVAIPRNASVKGKPYAALYLKDTFDYSAINGVQLTAVWGWPTAPPAVVKEACMVQAARFFRRKDAPLGVVGTETETIRLGSLDPDLKMLLGSLRKWPVG